MHLVGITRGYSRHLQRYVSSTLDVHAGREAEDAVELELQIRSSLYHLSTALLTIDDELSLLPVSIVRGF